MLAQITARMSAILFWA